MGTKNEPGQFDCFAAAEDDEPMFVLLARDELAASMVAMWAALRIGAFDAAQLAFDTMKGQALRYAGDYADTDKAGEASQCAAAMVAWIAENRPGKLLSVMMPDRETMLKQAWTHQVQWIEEGKPCMLRRRSKEQAEREADTLRAGGLRPVVIDLHAAFATLDAAATPARVAA